ncbi:MAG TPA: glycoside hydrolase family 44 protein, partial [Myxococcota bacterium]|nr:glycoside hydrolase family 44 protein [Myxococcota bacterium]
AAADDAIQQIIFDGGLKGGWQDWGWAKRTVEAGKPASLQLNKYAGWILAYRGLEGRFSAVGFNLKAPASFGDFLEVRVSGDDDSLPRIPVTADKIKPLDGGWVQVRIAMSDLNPEGAPFDRVVLRANKSVGEEPVLVDKVVLYGGGAESPSAPVVVKSHPASLSLDCKAPSQPISPLIYGIAFSPRHAKSDAFQWELGASARRWGGNPASRYNWRLGNAWNTAMDWFFTNVNYTPDPDYSWKDFLDENQSHKVATALTVPMIGWVAKDTESYAFPVSVYGPQQYAQQDAGNGMRQGGGKITGADPKRTSIEAPPSFVGEWVQAINAYDNAKGVRHIQQYILDNEPALWNSTHRDVHPDALTYDELLKRTIDYGEQVRKNDPKASIAGPAEWGWPAYFFSAKDAEVGFNMKPDRRAHGDVPLMEWYLRQLRAHEQKTGRRILDVLDVHYYPQTKGLYGQGEKTDPASAEKRVRSTRSL